MCLLAYFLYLTVGCEFHECRQAVSRLLLLSHSTNSRRVYSICCKKGRAWKEGRKEERKEGREEGRGEGRRKLLLLLLALLSIYRLSSANQINSYTESVKVLS